MLMKKKTNYYLKELFLEEKEHYLKLKYINKAYKITWQN